MRWRLEFYNERRRTLARYAVESATPAGAVQLGRDALRAEHPPVRRRPSLLERAERVGGLDPGGWVLYRITKDASS
jgi:hypothetical protein